MSTTLPPPPTNDMRDLPHSVHEWLRKVWLALGGATPSGTIPWSQVSKSGSNLTDLTTRNHNDTQNKQGGTGTEFYHLTNAEHSLVSTIAGTQAAGTVLSGPISGAAATPTFKTMRQLKWKDSDQSKTNNITVADDTDLVFAIGANEKWIGRCFIDVGAGLTTTGIKVTIAAPSGASGNIHCVIMTNASGGQEIEVQSTATLGSVLDFTAAAFPVSATIGMMEIVWRVANSTNAGNISVQWAQSTSSGTALTLGAGSQLTADRVA